MGLRREWSVGEMVLGCTEGGRYQWGAGVGLQEGVRLELTPGMGLRREWSVVGGSRKKGG
jgi:hypothetical protein